MLRVGCPISTPRSYPGDDVSADHSIHFAGVEVLEAVPAKILIQPSVVGPPFRKLALLRWLLGFDGFQLFGSLLSSVSCFSCYSMLGGTFVLD